jgi:hypothetical protein
MLPILFLKQGFILILWDKVGENKETFPAPHVKVKKKKEVKVKTINVCHS